MFTVKEVRKERRIKQTALNVKETSYRYEAFLSTRACSLVKFVTAKRTLVSISRYAGPDKHAARTCVRVDRPRFNVYKVTLSFFTAG
jgi:hypothetical protein